MWLQPDPAQALAFAVRLCATAQLVGLLELTFVRRELRPGGFLDWSIIGLLSPKTHTCAGSLVRRTFRKLRPRAFGALLILTGVIAAALLVRPTAWTLIAVAAGLQIVLMKRHHMTIDGSDQMTLMVLIVCLLARAGGNAITMRAAVTFLAAELTLAYLVAGLSKATSTHWRSEQAFATILKTRMYGQAAAARILDHHRALGKPAAYATFCWEVLFIVSLTAPLPAVLAILAIGLGFHVACALIMGLNRFVWAFAASYPALICTNLAIRAVIGEQSADFVAIALGAAAVLGLVVLTRPRLRNAKYTARAVGADPQVGSR